MYLVAPVTLVQLSLGLPALVLEMLRVGFARSQVRSLPSENAEVGVTYTYKVKALCSNSAATSAFSNTVSSMLAAPVLTKSHSEDKPYFTWTTVPGATEYYVEFSWDGGNTWFELYSGTMTSYRHTSATKGNTYHYRVMASSPTGSSEFSNVVDIYCPK